MFCRGDPTHYPDCTKCIVGMTRPAHRPYKICPPTKPYKISDRWVHILECCPRFMACRHTPEDAIMMIADEDNGTALIVCGCMWGCA